MKKSICNMAGMAALVLTFGVLIIACSGKAEAQSSGGSSGGTASAGSSGGSSGSSYKRAKEDGIYTSTDPSYEGKILYIAGRSFLIYPFEDGDKQITAVELTPAFIEESGTTNFKVGGSSISYTNSSGKARNFAQQKAGKKNDFDGLWADSKGNIMAFIDGSGVSLSASGSGLAYPPFEGNSGSVMLNGNTFPFSLTRRGDTLLLLIGSTEYVCTPGTWDAAVADKAWKAYVASIKNPSGSAPASDFSYDLNEDGKGIMITKYTGKGGKVIIPAKIEDYPVTAIKGYAFYGESMTLQGGFTYGDDPIGPGYAITEVVIPNTVSYINSMAFLNCKKLTSVTIGRSSVVLDEWVFRGCENLAALNIPDGDNVLQSDGAYHQSFLGCKKLPLAMRARLKAMGFDEP